jgi:hypothetical protein
MGGDDIRGKEDESGFRHTTSADDCPPCRYRMSIRIWHPEIDPVEVTRTLGIAPRHAWRVGEPRVTPTGRSLGGVRDKSYWCAEVSPAHARDSDPEGDVVRFLDMLEPHARLLQDIVTSGGTIEFFLTFWHGGTTFSATRGLRD